MMGESNAFGVVANVISDRVLRTGAKVWICYVNGDASCPRVIGLSKNGRLVEKYTHYKRFENFRAKWVPEHLRNGVPGRHWLGVILIWPTKEEAQHYADCLNEMWRGVRFFHHDGRLLLDGDPESEAFRRAHRRWAREKGGST